MSDITITPPYNPTPGLSIQPVGEGGGKLPDFQEFLLKFQPERPMLPGQPILGPNQTGGDPNAMPGSGNVAGGFGPPASLPQAGGQAKNIGNIGQDSPVAGPFGPPSKLPG